MAEPLAALKSNWNKLSAASAWLLLVVGSFIQPPPVGAGQFGGAGKMTALSRYVLPLCVGLIMVPLARFGRKRYTRTWWKAGAATLFAAAVCFFSYEWLSTRWTCSYNHQPVVIGSEFMPGREEWTKTNGRFFECHDWIMAHGGKVEDIWTKSSIDRRCANLSALYIVSLPIAALAMICILQAIYCNSRKN